MSKFNKVKVKLPLTIRSSHGRLWGCSTHLALLAKGAGVQLPGHVASLTKLLSGEPVHGNGIYLPTRAVPIYLLAL